MGDMKKGMIALVAFLLLGPQATASSVIFPVQGNVYPLGHYIVHLNIGNPPKVYDLDIDTGSDLTWVQCDAPCKGCTKPLDSLYKPNENFVKCKEPACAALPSPVKLCNDPDDYCRYRVNYADHGSSLGVLVKDHFPLRLINGATRAPILAFGCGYDQTYSGSNSPPSTAGVLGLGNGKVSILSQLNGIALVQNVIGHCLRRGVGFLFFGGDLVPSSGITWTPMLSNPSENYYSPGPAELLFNGMRTGLKVLDVIFDSGTTYTYFNSQAYQATVNLIKNELKGKPLKDAPEDRSLSICWKGGKPFKSVADVKNYFKPLALNFPNAKNVQLQLPIEAYLIVTQHGNVCLGILDSSEAGLANSNIIGDISLQDKMVIYDNEKRRIGWAPSNCRIPKS